MSTVPIEHLSSVFLEELMRKIAHELETRPIDDSQAYLEAWRARVPERKVEYKIEKIAEMTYGSLFIDDEYQNSYEVHDSDPSEEELKEYLALQAIEKFVRYEQ